MIVGENIAAGFDSPGAACSGWMNSPGHRANILRSSFTGSVADTRLGDRGYGRYYVQVFADVARIDKRAGRKPPPTSVQ